MRSLVISDIHGCYDEFMELLDMANYTPGKDRLLLLGDYVDRGPKSREVLDAVIELEKDEHVIVLRGNHDERFLRFVQDERLDLYERFITYGGIETLASYGYDAEQKSMEATFQELKEKYTHHFTFLSQTAYYYEDERFIYVHAGINPNVSDWKTQSPKDFMTIREEFYGNETKLDKRVIFGHTVTTKLHGRPDIWFAEDKIGIDGGCAMGHQLNCLEIKADGQLTVHAVSGSGGLVPRPRLL